MEHFNRGNGKRVQAKGRVMKIGTLSANLKKAFLYLNFRFFNLPSSTNNFENFSIISVALQSQIFDLTFIAIHKFAFECLIMSSSSMK